MDKKTKALKLALEALEAHADIGIKSDKAITAIREALAEQPAEQEPVAHLYRDHNGELRLNCITPVPYFAFPVYTAPQPAIDAALVRAQALKEAWDAVNKTPGAEVRCDCMNGWATVKACADAIVALKEKT